MNVDKHDHVTFLEHQIAWSRITEIITNIYEAKVLFENEVASPIQSCCRRKLYGQASISK
jgi:hypothetical protein